MHVKKGMLVKVVSGNHKGMEGKILNVFPKKDSVIIEGCLLYTSDAADE